MKNAVGQQPQWLNTESGKLVGNGILIVLLNEMKDSSGGLTFWQQILSHCRPLFTFMTLIKSIKLHLNEHISERLILSQCGVTKICTSIQLLH